MGRGGGAVLPSTLKPRSPDVAVGRARPHRVRREGSLSAIRDESHTYLVPYAYETPGGRSSVGPGWLEKQGPSPAPVFHTPIKHASPAMNIAIFIVGFLIGLWLELRKKE